MDIYLFLTQPRKEKNNKNVNLPNWKLFNFGVRYIFSVVIIKIQSHLLLGGTNPSIFSSYFFEIIVYVFCLLNFRRRFFRFRKYGITSKN